MIWMSHFQFYIYLAFNDIYDNFFLLSNQSRRAVLTGGAIMRRVVNKDQTISIKWYEIVRYLDEVGFQKIRFLDNQNNSIELTENQLEEGQYFMWLGTNMQIPPKTKITLDFDKVYPNFFLGVKKEDSFGGKDEIFLQEGPWSLNAICNGNFLDEGKIQSDRKLTITDNGEYIQNYQPTDKHVVVAKLDPFQKTLNFYPRVKGQNFKGMHMGTDFTDKDNFTNIEMWAELHTEDYDLVLLIPYTPPKADMLLSLKIKDNKNDTHEEVILSST